MVSPVKGLQIPQVTTAERDTNFASVPNGFMIENITTNTVQVTQTGGSSWDDVATGAAAGDLLAANNLSDVASKDVSLRNLGGTTDADNITDNLDRTYTSSNQPALIFANYTESGHTIQLCPFNETASPVAGTTFCIVVNLGISSATVLDASGGEITVIFPGEAYYYKNTSNTLSGSVFGYSVVNAVNFGSGNITVDLQSAFDAGYPGFNLNTSAFNIFNTNTTLNCITNSPVNGGSAAQDGVQGSVFDVDEDIWVTALQVWDGHFNVSTSQTSAIYDRNTQQLLVAADVLKTDPLVSGFRTHTLDIPIRISQGTTIASVTRYYAGDFYNNAITANTGLTSIESCASLNTSGMEFPTVFGGLAGQGTAGFFQFQPISTIMQISSAEANLNANLNVNNGRDILVSGGGDVTTATGRFFGSNPGGGDPAQPTYSSAASTTTGFDIPGAGAARIISSGTPIFEISGTQAKVLPSTATTSTTTGALTNAGGFGNSGDIRMGGDYWNDTLITSVATSRGVVSKIICNEAIGAGLICKASSTVEFRIETLKTTDGDDTGVICVAKNTTTAAGQTQEVYGLNVVPVVINGAVTQGDPLEKSGVVNGRVVAAAASPGTFAVALQSGVVNDTILAAIIKNEVF